VAVCKQQNTVGRYGTNDGHHRRQYEGETIAVLVHRVTVEGDAALPATFHRLVVAWAGSLTGDGLRVVALPLLAVSLNPSATAVAAVAAASTPPK
jgi:hypothetical protein